VAGVGLGVALEKDAARKAIQAGRTRLQYAEFEEQRRNLIRYASRITGNRDHAEDGVQEAYLRLGEMARKQHLASPGGYLSRIVRNLAIDRLWRSRRDGEVFAPDGQAALDEMAAVQPTPEQVVLSRNELMRLEAALAELPERVRIAVEMHRFGGAKGWGVPLGGVIGSELWRERAKDPPPLPAAIVGVGMSEAFGTLISSKPVDN